MLAACRPHILRAVDVFRTPDERFEGLPGYDFEPHYAEVDGLRLHYVDEGRGRGPVVCFHGEPTWAYLYRKMLAAAGRRRDTGWSAPTTRASGAPTSPPTAAGTRYDRHVELVGELLDGLELSDAVVVVQDWGGPIGLRWAVENADRVGALVILNTGLFTGRVSKGFMAWRDFAEKNPDLPVGFVIQGGDDDRAARRRGRRLRGALPDRRSRRRVPRSSRCSCRPTRTPRRGRRCARSPTRSGAGRSRRWSPSPTAIRSSPSRGRASASSSGSRRSSEQVTIEGAAHFLQEDRGEQIAGEILRFLGLRGRADRLERVARAAPLARAGGGPARRCRATRAACRCARAARCRKRWR